MYVLNSFRNQAIIRVNEFAFCQIIYLIKNLFSSVVTFFFEIVEPGFISFTVIILIFFFLKLENLVSIVLDMCLKSSKRFGKRKKKEKEKKTGRSPSLRPKPTVDVTMASTVAGHAAATATMARRRHRDAGRGAGRAGCGSARGGRRWRRRPFWATGAAAAACGRRGRQGARRR